MPENRREKEGQVQVTLGRSLKGRLDRATAEERPPGGRSALAAKAVEFFLDLRDLGVSPHEYLARLRGGQNGGR